MSRHILLIDDDDSVRDILRRGLEEHGLRVSEATDGDKGLRHYRSDPADLVICDIVMPNKEGLETLKELKELPNAPKVMMLSAGLHGNTVFLEIANMLGADQVASKPVEWDVVWGKIQPLLGL